MRLYIARYAALALAGALAWGQADPPQTETLKLTNPATPQELQEILSAVRTVTGITRPQAADNAIRVTATAGQIEMARWLIAELDRPAAGPLPPNSSPRQLRVPDSGEDIVQVLFLAEAKTPQEVQEVMSAARAMSDLRRMFPVFSRRALCARGPASAVQVAAWVADALYLAPPPSKPPLSREYNAPFEGERVRVYYLPQLHEPRLLADVPVAIRAAAGIRRMYPFAARMAVAVRGTTEELETAGRVIGERW